MNCTLHDVCSIIQWSICSIIQWTATFGSTGGTHGSPFRFSNMKYIQKDVKMNTIQNTKKNPNLFDTFTLGLEDEFQSVTYQPG